MTSEPSTTVVRYNPVVAAAFLVLGAVNTVLGVLQVVGGGGVGSLLIISLVFLVIGVLFLTRPYLRVAPGQIEVVGPIGVGNRTYRYRRLRLEGHVPVAEDVDGTRRRVAAQRWFARRADWDAMVEEIRRGRGSTG